MTDDLASYWDDMHNYVYFSEEDWSKHLARTEQREPRCPLCGCLKDSVLA